jgi:hypothetical protein
MIPDPPCVVIPLDWGTQRRHAQGFQRQLTLDVFVDGERVSHAVSLAEDGILEVSFRIDPGEYEVVIKEAALGEREENACALLFARKMRVDYPGGDDEDDQAKTGATK